MVSHVRQYLTEQIGNLLHRNKANEIENEQDIYEIGQEDEGEAVIIQENEKVDDYSKTFLNAVFHGYNDLSEKYGKATLATLAIGTILYSCGRTTEACLAFSGVLAMKNTKIIRKAAEPVLGGCLKTTKFTLSKLFLTKTGLLLTGIGLAISYRNCPVELLFLRDYITDQITSIDMHYQLSQLKDYIYKQISDQITSIDMHYQLSQQFDEAINTMLAKVILRNPFGQATLALGTHQFFKICGFLGGKRFFTHRDTLLSSIFASIAMYNLAYKDYLIHAFAAASLLGFGTYAYLRSIRIKEQNIMQAIMQKKEDQRKAAKFRDSLCALFGQNPNVFKGPVKGMGNNTVQLVINQPPHQKNQAAQVQQQDQADQPQPQNQPPQAAAQPQQQQDNSAQQNAKKKRRFLGWF